MHHDAIHTALNALAVLEEYAPEDSRRLRRLLPALAVHFAKAGQHLTENDLLDMVTGAQIQGTPLSELFNSEPPQKNKVKSYNTIAAKLNPKHRTLPTPEEILAFGRMDLIERRRYDILELDSHAEAIKAARLGHLSLCEYFLERVPNPAATGSGVIREAFKSRQYHIAKTLRKHYSYDTLDKDTQSEYDGFTRLLENFQKSTPDLDPACLTGLESWQHVPLKLGPYLKIRDILKNEIADVRLVNQYAFRATLLFQSPQNLLRFFNQWGMPGETPLLTLIHPMHEMPIARHVDWPSWGQAVVKHGPSVFFPLRFAQQITSPCKNDQGAISLALTRKKVWENYEIHDPEYRRIGELCYELQTKVAIVEKAVDFWKQSSRFTPPPSETVPDIDLDGSSFGLNGYKLTKIPYGDPRIMFLGYYTGCCEKVGDHFEDTVEHAITTRESGFYVLTKDDEIRAHSWVWRGDDQQLIIDGWESKDPLITTDKLARLTRAIGQKLCEPVYKDFAITDVLLGTSNQNLNVEECFEEARYPSKRFILEDYYNYKYCQWHVCRINTPKWYLPQIAPSNKP